MDSKVFAPFAKSNGDGTVSIDINSFIVRFLLFDHYTIDSMLMKDLAQLISTLGVDGMQELLQSGAISIHTSALTIGQIENTSPNESRARPTTAGHQILPYNHFDPVVVDIADREEYIGHGFRNINALGYPGRRVAQLKQSILDNLTEIPNTRNEMIAWMQQALSDNEPIVKKAVINAASQRSHRIESPAGLEVHFEVLGDNTIKVRSNLRQVLSIDEFEEHKILEKTMLSIGGFYQRLSIMKAYDSIAWFSDEDSMLLKEEMKRVAVEVDSNQQEARFARVLRLRGLPVLGDTNQINAHHLLNLRESRECREFREWLLTTDARSDQNIQDELQSFRAAFTNALGTPVSRVARFAMSAVVGTINPIAGLALGVTDQFILDKILKRNGPIWFINNELPKLGDPIQ